MPHHDPDSPPPGVNPAWLLLAALIGLMLALGSFVDALIRHLWP